MPCPGPTMKSSTISSSPASSRRAIRPRCGWSHAQQPAPVPRRLRDPRQPRRGRGCGAKRLSARLRGDRALRRPLGAFDLAHPDRDQRSARPAAGGEKAAGALDGASVTILDDYREKLMQGSMSGTSPDREQARAELRAMMEEAIARLPEPFRLVFVLREIEGIGVEEVSETLGILPGDGEDPPSARAAAAPAGAGARSEGRADGQLPLRRRRLRGADRAGGEGLLRAGVILPRIRGGGHFSREAFMDRTPPPSRARRRARLAANAGALGRNLRRRRSRNPLRRQADRRPAKAASSRRNLCRRRRHRPLSGRGRGERRRPRRLALRRRPRAPMASKISARISASG